MYFSRQILLTALSCCALAGGSAWAEEPATQSQVNGAQPEQLEAPQTREEVQAVFAALDRDDDERISRSESHREPTLRKRFAGVDSSGDGFLSRNEFEARPRAERFE